MGLMRFDWRVFPLLGSLMLLSLLVLSSMTSKVDGVEELVFWTPLVKAQLKWFCLGWTIFFFLAFFDYRRLKDYSLPLYVGILLLLVGLFFVAPIQNVHRWYRIPGVMSFQPSEQAKLIVILFMSYFLERKGSLVGSVKSALQMGLIVGVPFLLILKQPDLGTALVLFPIGMMMGYFAGMHTGVFRAVFVSSVLVMGVFILLFSGTLSHEKMKPFFTCFLKEYQYERLNPNSYHQKAAEISIALGGVSGVGWRQSEFAGNRWLPMAHTDSVFAALAEELGLIGVAFLLFLFCGLIYCSFQVAAVAKDPFGRYLAVGLTAYLAMHMLINSAMMCALLPISGVPLVLITYGGSSITSAMGALGLLQSIYSRRFMF